MADSSLETPTEGKPKVGRPLKFADHYDLKSAIDEYFEECDAGKERQVIYKGEVMTITEPIPYTIMGLCDVLDCDRSTLIDYGNGKYDSVDPEFSHTVKKAKRKVARQVEQNMYVGKNPAGPIFSLKNNFGWSDKSELDLRSPDGSMTPKDGLAADKRTVDSLVEMLKQSTAEGAS